MIKLAIQLTQAVRDDIIMRFPFYVEFISAVLVAATMGAFLALSVRDAHAQQRVIVDQTVMSSEEHRVEEVRLQGHIDVLANQVVTNKEEIIKLNTQVQALEQQNNDLKNDVSVARDFGVGGPSIYILVQIIGFGMKKRRESL